MFRKRPTATGGGGGSTGSGRIHVNGGSSSTTVLLEQSATSTLNGRNGTNSTTMLPLHHHQTSMSPLVDKDDADAYNEKYDKNRRSGGGGSYSQRRRRSQQQRERLASSMLLCMGILYLVKRMVFPLSHDQLNAVDQTVRRLWVAAEHYGLIEKFPAYSTDYMEHFPYFSLLEEHYQVIREEAQQLLDSNTRNHIPRLKDLVETKRAQGKVYSTDWKTCTCFLTKDSSDRNPSLLYHGVCFAFL
jgi:hypothetical protein